MSLVTTLSFCKFQIANKADKSQNQKKSLFFEKKQGKHLVDTTKCSTFALANKK